MRKCLQILLVLAMPILSQAQFFPPETIVNSESHPGNGFLCDVDGDGDEDVVQSDLFIPKRHRIYYRNGTDFDDVFYTSTMELSNSSFSRLKGYADFDADGDPDFYSGYGWMENENGIIVAGHFFHVDHHYSEATAAGDFNNDGHIDVVMSNCVHGISSNSHHLMVMLNNGSGQFLESTNFTQNPTGVTVSDVDENGTLDLVYYFSVSDTWYYYSGNGDGTFDAVAILLSGITGTTILADLNVDGFSDVIDVVNNMPANGTASLNIYYGQTGLGFENPVSFTVNSFQTIWYDNVTNLLTDYDGDGDLDILLKPNRNIYWIENHNNTYIDRGRVMLRQDQARSLFWTDINEDGRMDALETGDHLITCMQNADSKLYPKDISGEGGVYAGGPFMMIDENNDGVDDMLSFHGSGAFVVNSMNEFNYVSSNVVAFGDSDKLLAHIDYNKDGLKDIIQRDFYGINCYEKVADYTYKAPEKIFLDLVGTAFAVTSYDVDQDGSDDVLVALSNTQYQVFWYKCIEGAGWQSQGLFADIGTTGLGTYRLFPFNTGDFNGDGVKDLSLVTPNSCTMFIQLGGGEFDIQSIYTAPDMNDLLLMGDHAVADFNLDGRDDLMFLQKNMDTDLKKFFIARYNGTTYEAIVAHQFTFNELDYSYPAPVWVASDFDSDGDVDIVYSANDKIKRSMNNGNGFSSSQFLNITAQNPITSINVADIDGDIMPDLVFGGLSGATGSWVQSAINNLDSPYQIQLSAFIDYDGDGLLNGFDEPLINQQIALSGDWGYAFTDELGQFTFYGIEGPMTATMTMDEDLWTPITPLIQTVELTDVSPTATMVFAITPNNTVHNVQGSIITMADVCGSDYGHWITIYNAGNTIASGAVTYTLDNGFTYTWGSPTPTSVDGQTITWEYSDLNFNQSITYAITAASPGVESIGTTVSHQLFVTSLDDQGAILSTSTDDNTYVIECAYDPNDLTENFGWSTPGYIEAQGLLEYTVRFQNLGNAPATDIRVENLLSELHNRGTVVAVASSHNYTIDQDAQGRLNFFFENINLPAAEDDEPGSHGFITFRIRSADGMNPGDQIVHQAAIYFDLNPPIFTNEVTNTILDCTSLEITIPDGICSGSDVQVESSRDEFVDYVWSTGLTILGNGAISFISFENSGVQNLKLEVSNPVCTIEAEMTVEILASPSFDEGVTEMTYCGEPLNASATGNGEINWSLLGMPLGVGDNLTIDAPGVYLATLTNTCGSATKEVIILEGIEPYISGSFSDQIICSTPIEISAEGVGDLAWYQNDMFIGYETLLQITEAGTYRIEATTSCGTVEESFAIIQGLLPEFNDVSETALLCDASIMLSAYGNGSIQWLINDEIVSSEETLEVYEVGVYEAIVTTECGAQSIDVMVNEGVVPAFSAISEDGLVCEAPLILFAEGNGEISWFFDSASIGSSATIEILQAGIYSAVITTSCGSVAEEVLVETGTLPEITSISEDTFLCGETISITANANSDVSWFLGDDFIATQSEITITNPGTYRIEVQTNCGIAIDEVVVSLGEPAVLSSISSDVVFCGTPVALNALGNGELTWYSGETPIGSGNQIEVNNEGTYVVQVQTECGIAEGEIAVQSGSSPEFTQITESLTLCDGAATLSATGQGELSWLQGEVILSASEEFEVFEPGLYIALLSNMCGLTSANVEVFPAIIPAFVETPIDMESCGESILVNVAGMENELVTWYVDDIVMAEGNEYIVQSSAEFTIQLDNGCAVYSETVDYTIHDLPTVTLEWDEINQVVVATEGFISYAWSDNGIPVPDVNVNIYSPQSSLVEVEVVDNNGCSASESILISGVEERLLNTLQIYPNPAEDFLYVSLPEKNEALTVDIIDGLGKVIHSQRIYSTGVQVIQLNSLAAGIYTMRCGRISEKLIIK